jgi:hypothetical protein
MTKQNKNKMKKPIVGLLVVVFFIETSLADRIPSFKTTIRKCCPPDHILDERYLCVKLPDELSKSDKYNFLRQTFWEAFCRDEKCRDLRFKTVGFSGCPGKKLLFNV